MKKIKKGFTLIEILITLALIGIVLGAISSFFLANYNTLHNVSKELDFQREGEKAINFIVEKAMESKGIGEIQPNNNVNSNNEKDITKVVFKVSSNSEDNTEKGHIFSIVQVNGVNELRYGTGILDSVSSIYSGNTDIIIARGIKSIELKSGKEEGLKVANSVEITIKLEKSQVNSQVYFRNKE